MGMTTTTYYATTADEQLTKAQWILDTHITSSVTGRCLACGTFGPCWRRETAVSIFSRTLLRATGVRHQPLCPQRRERRHLGP